MESVLGTLWFVCLVGVLSFGLGVWWSDKVKNILGR